MSQHDLKRAQQLPENLFLMAIEGAMMYYEMQDADKKTNKTAGDGKGMGKGKEGSGKENKKKNEKEEREKREQEEEKGEGKERREELLEGDKLHVYP